ncbi:hypothetical protein HDE_10684 [Halotydeus destructor]|nr:hypothetical protein HDE_10684 [Halotydeus destructor]
MKLVKLFRHVLCKAESHPDQDKVIPVEEETLAVADKCQVVDDTESKGEPTELSEPASELAKILNSHEALQAAKKFSPKKHPRILGSRQNSRDVLYIVPEVPAEHATADYETFAFPPNSVDEVEPQGPKEHVRRRPTKQKSLDELKVCADHYDVPKKFSESGLSSPDLHVYTNSPDQFMTGYAKVDMSPPAEGASPRKMARKMAPTTVYNKIDFHKTEALNNVRLQWQFERSLHHSVLPSPRC